MLREILAITGKPGLFKIVAHNNQRLIVEDLQTGKRFPANSRDKVVSLGDVAMYSEGDDRPLGEILDSLYAKTEGKPVDVKKLVKENGLRALFEQVLPDYDRDRVYDNDIRKLFNWYNVLLSAGYTKFTEEKEEDEKKEEEKEDK